MSEPPALPPDAAAPASQPAPRRLVERRDRFFPPPPPPAARAAHQRPDRQHASCAPDYADGSFSRACGVADTVDVAARIADAAAELSDYVVPYLATLRAPAPPARPSLSGRP